MTKKSNYKQYDLECRKEAKESSYWLKLIDTEGEPTLDRQRDTLVQESTELMNIFGAILQKVK